MPLKFYGLDKVGAGPLLMCTYLWRYVASRKALGGPHWVFHTNDQVADAVREVTKRTITTYLQRLRSPLCLVTAGTINGQWGFWLYTPAGCEDEKQPPDRTVEEQIERMRHGDLRWILPRSPGDRGRFASEIAEDSIGDLPPFDAKLPPHPLRVVKLTIAAAAPTAPTATAAAAAADLPRSPGRSLLAELAGPLAERGAKLPPARRTVELLDLLLKGPGFDATEYAAMRAHVAEHVLAFADICAGHPEQRRWLCGEMFSQVIPPGKKLSRWGAIEQTVATHAALNGVREHGKAAEAATLEARRARVQREAEEQAQLQQRRMTAESISAVLAETGLFRGEHERPSTRSLESKTHEERLARNRELATLRASLERLARGELLALQAEVRRNLAAEQDDERLATLKTHQAAISNRLGALDEQEADAARSRNSG